MCVCVFLIVKFHTRRLLGLNAKIDKTQQNSKNWLCGDKVKTINHIISECNKLSQKEYKAKHDWVGKVIQWELCKKFKFDQTNKW